MLGACKLILFELFDKKIKAKTVGGILTRGTAVLGVFLLLGACSSRVTPYDPAVDGPAVDMDDEQYQRVLDLLNKYPVDEGAPAEEPTETKPSPLTDSKKEDQKKGPVEPLLVPDTEVTTDNKTPWDSEIAWDSKNQNPIPDKDAAEIMEFVDQATIKALMEDRESYDGEEGDVLSDKTKPEPPSMTNKADGKTDNNSDNKADNNSDNKTENKNAKNQKGENQTTADNKGNQKNSLGDKPSVTKRRPFLTQPAEPLRHCTGDGLDQEKKLYNESVSDECLFPKLRSASELFSIKYAFARCIFEKENPHRDRLAHNYNGSGLAQIVNPTMKEINNRWNRADKLSGLLKQCLQWNSNRADHYLDAVNELLVPSQYLKNDIFKEAAYHPPSIRVNPLYRDDSVCLGLMTMGIKVQEANGRRNDKKVSDEELARRYNGSKYQRRYARAVVECVGQFKKGLKTQARR